MDLTKIENIILTAIYVVAGGIIAAQVLAQNTLLSILFYFSFVLVLILWFLTILRLKMNRADFFVFLIIVCTVFCVWLNAALNGAKLSFSYVKKMLMFISTVIFFQTSGRICIRVKQAKIVKNIIMIVGGLFILCYYVMDKSILYYFDGRVSDYLTFNFTNPNLLALFLACIAGVALIQTLQVKKKWQKIVCFFFLIHIIWLISETGSRNSHLAIIVLLILCAGIYFSKRERFCFSRTVSMIFAIFPMAFSLIYMSMFNLNYLDYFDFMSGTGKAMDARVIIWNKAFTSFRDSPWIGAYAQMSRGTGWSQLHNTHVDVLSSYGLIVFIPFIIWLFMLLYNGGKKYQKKDFIYVLCFVSVILLGLGEAAIFSGGIGIYLFAGVFLLLKDGEEETLEHSA